MKNTSAVPNEPLIGTCVHGMASPSLDVCARNEFSPMSETLIFVDPNALDVCARNEPIFVKKYCVLLQKCYFFWCAPLDFLLRTRGEHVSVAIFPPKFNLQNSTRSRHGLARVSERVGTEWKPAQEANGPFGVLKASFSCISSSCAPQTNKSFKSLYYSCHKSFRGTARTHTHLPRTHTLSSLSLSFYKYTNAHVYTVMQRMAIRHCSSNICCKDLVDIFVVGNLQKNKLFQWFFTFVECC